jgi:hypothetical protein
MYFHIKDETTKLNTTGTKKIVRKNRINGSRWFTSSAKPKETT